VNGFVGNFRAVHIDKDKGLSHARSPVYDGFAGGIEERIGGNLKRIASRSGEDADQAALASRLFGGRKNSILAANEGHRYHHAEIFQGESFFGDHSHVRQDNFGLSFSQSFPLVGPYSGLTSAMLMAS